MKTKQHYLSVILVTAFIFLTHHSLAQPEIEWQRSYGGTSVDVAHSIQQTTDGGYAIAGFSNSNDGDVSENYGGLDYWIVKLDDIGNIQWQKNFGGSANDHASSILQITDGSYIVTGNSNSNDGDVSGNNGGTDYWIVKLDSTGNIQWQKSLGGSSFDSATSTQQTNDGGYIVAGSSHSNDGDVSGNNGGQDYWIVKLDSTGNMQWQKSLGGTGDDIARSVQQTIDGGYIVTGSSSSNDGDVSGNNGGSDYWVVKLDTSGNIEWQKSLGGTGDDVAHSVQQTIDEGYILTGYSNSNDGDVNENYGGTDYWIVKLDGIGNIQWQKNFGGLGNDRAFSIVQTTNGGYVVAGNSSSNDGDVSGNHGGADYWIVKIDNAGNLQWQKSYGGSSADFMGSIDAIRQTTDGGFVVAGYSHSSDGDVTSNLGGSDFWIVKLYPDTASIQEHDVFGINLYPNPAKNTLHIDTQNQTIDKINIYSISGVLIQEYKIDTVSPTIDVTSLTTGMYFVQLHSGKEIALKKFLKE